MNQDDFKQLVEEHGQMSHYLGWTVLPNIIMVIIIVIILMIVFTIIPVPPILLLVLFSGIVSFSTILALYHLQNNRFSGMLNEILNKRANDKNFINNTAKKLKKVDIKFLESKSIEDHKKYYLILYDLAGVRKK